MLEMTFGNIEYELSLKEIKLACLTGARAYYSTGKREAIKWRTWRPVHTKNTR